MAETIVDRNLLFGILALQMDFIGREDLVDGFHSWVLAKQRPLGEVLESLGKLKAARRQLVDALVAEHVAVHGSIAKSLWALNLVEVPTEALNQIADPDLQAWISNVWGKRNTVRDSRPNNQISHAKSDKSLDDVESGLAHLSESPTGAVSLANESAFDASNGDASRGIGISGIVRRERFGNAEYWFGDYLLHRQLGRSEMGVVFLATQSKLKRLCALKLIRSGESSSAEQVERFRRETETAARLDHPGIVPVYEVGEHCGQHYFSMAYVGGKSLADHLRLGPLPPTDAAWLALHTARALQYAHERRLIHRNVKPANIMLPAPSCRLNVDSATKSLVAEPVKGPENDSKPDLPSPALLPANGDQLGLRPTSMNLEAPKLTDFGLAKCLDDETAHLPPTGQVMVTTGYMSPEQVSGDREVGPATDVYGLGAVLYHCLTGRPPFQAATPFQTIQQVITADPVPPRQLVPMIPKDLETICLKCLSKEAEHRYPSALELALDLGRFLNREPIQAPVVGPIGQLAKWTRGNPIAAAVLTAIPPFVSRGPAFGFLCVALALALFVDIPLRLRRLPSFLGLATAIPAFAIGYFAGSAAIATAIGMAIAVSTTGFCLAMLDSIICDLPTFQGRRKYMVIAFGLILVLLPNLLRIMADLALPLSSSQFRRYYEWLQLTPDFLSQLCFHSIVGACIGLTVRSVMRRNSRVPVESASFGALIASTICITLSLDSLTGSAFEAVRAAVAGVSVFRSPFVVTKFFEPAMLFWSLGIPCLAASCIVAALTQYTAKCTYARVGMTTLWKGACWGTLGLVISLPLPFNLAELSTNETIEGLGRFWTVRQKHEILMSNLPFFLIGGSMIGVCAFAAADALGGTRVRAWRFWPVFAIPSPEFALLLVFATAVGVLLPSSEVNFASIGAFVWTAVLGYSCRDRHQRFFAIASTCILGVLASLALLLDAGAIKSYKRILRVDEPQVTVKDAAPGGAVELVQRMPAVNAQTKAILKIDWRQPEYRQLLLRWCLYCIPTAIGFSMLAAVASQTLLRRLRPESESDDWGDYG